ncbi:hypothetical protein JCM19237_1255 [Photobacterium aphoticum]|uniref:Uncharacterized protein n=1 Tax=Photobacterium aphoticum TaxID=754436 RepID=A0A090QQQ6_9GAMM|nr:hypothetical protein JCM19237_1255 [Photobacterium aphoticum]
MNKNKHLSLVLALLPAPLFAQTPPADSITVPMPTVYGDIRAQAAWHQDKDYTTDIYQATVGAIGNLGYQDLKVRYQLEAEYSESEHSADKDNDLIVREANIITMLPPWGAYTSVRGPLGPGRICIARWISLKVTTWNATATTCCSVVSVMPLTSWPT